jgi:hypothetical protein
LTPAIWVNIGSHFGGCSRRQVGVCGPQLFEFVPVAEECRPDEQAVAELPDFVLAAIAESSPRTVILGPQLPYSELSGQFDTTATPDRLTLPDSVVLGVMLRDPVARFYWHGRRRNATPSDDDFALACKLAFYCRHDLRQMYRLFMRSGLYRSRFEEARPGGNYALWTLKHAIEATPQTWIRRKRPRPSVATGAKTGRKILPRTIAVLDLHRQEPDLSNTQPATRLELTPRQVRDAIRYHGRSGVENAWLLIHSEGKDRGASVGPSVAPGLAHHRALRPRLT